MSAPTVDPFDLDERTGPYRDQYDRPLLVPGPGYKGPLTKRKEDGVEAAAYTRASTLANFVTDSHGLVVWEQWKLATGLSLREDLCALIAGLPPLNDSRCDKSTLTREQKQQDKATKKKLREHIEQAMESGGRNYKANHGTAIHQFIENGCIHDVPERMQPDVQSAFDEFRDKGIEIRASEVFTANDALMSAGSFDHIAWVPTLGHCIIDVKTGQIEDKDLSFAIQQAGYADGEIYDWRTDERAPLESLTGGERVNRRIAVICHVPLGGARTQLYAVDLARGLHAARLATNVRAARTLPGLMSPLEF